MFTELNTCKNVQDVLSRVDWKKETIPKAISLIQKPVSRPGEELLRGFQKERNDDLKETKVIEKGRNLPHGHLLARS